MEITISERRIRKAAEEGMDAFVMLFYNTVMESIGGQITPENIGVLTPDQTTLLAYVLFRGEVMDGGFVQLIHNGYGPFIFLNPFAKAMRLWGLHDFSNLIYKGRRLYEKYGDEITKPCTDEEFMALFEQYPQFDELDDAFIEMEEDVTAAVAQYIDRNILNFVVVED